MKPDTIIKRLGQPVTEIDGEFHCPVCDYHQPDYRIGPHMMKHWHEAGVVKGTEPHSKDIVHCPIGGCDHSSKRGTMTGHMRTVHDYEMRDAAAVSRTLDFNLDNYLANPPENRLTSVDDKRRARDRERKRLERLAAKRKRDADREAAETVGALIHVPTQEPDHDFARPHWEQINGTDAALAVILGTANGSVATELIPDIVNYVDHTREMVDKLRQR